MPYQVQVSGGQVVEFPDSVSQEEAQKILADQIQPTGEDIAGAMQDPAYKPSVDDYLKYEEYAKNKQVDWIDTIAKSVDAAATMIGGAVAEGAQGAAVNPLNYIEGAAQGTRQLYGLVAQSQDPASPLFRFKDLVAGTGTPESRYQQFLEARDFANTTARLERGEQGVIVPPEYTNPQFVQGVSMILDPTLALPGIGEMFGAGKLATRAVGKGAQLAGEAVAGVARPLERVAGASERMTAEALGMTPEGLRGTATTAGIAGALGIAPEAATLAAIPAGIRTTREAGEALARAGENLMTQPSRVGPLEAIGAAPGANMRQRMLGVIGQYGGDAALDAALRSTAGAIEGAAVGAGLGFLAGGEEGAAAGLGAGGVQGAAGALGGRAYQKLTGQAAREARAGDLGRFIDAQQDPTTKALFERVRDQHGVDAASALMDVEAMTKGRFGDVDVLYRSNKDFADQFGGSARGVQVVQAERPTIVINADIIGKGRGDTPLYTLGHELFHALEKSEQLAAGATEIKDALVGRWVQEGDVTRKLADGALTDAEIEAKFNEYRDKLGAGNAQAASDLSRYDTIDKRANYIASELAAEHFARLIAGQKPDAMLKGFSGLTRQLMDAALLQNASKAIANAAASIERTFGVKPTDSVLFPDLKQASPQLNAMLRDLVRARRKLDERILVEDSGPGKTLKPQDVANPIAAKQLVDLGVAERMADGSVRNLSDEEIRVREEKDTGAIRAILEGVPGARVVDGEIQGRFSPQQLSAIEQSQAVSSRMKDKIRAVNAAMDAGNSIFVNYGAATRRVKNRLTGKFTSKYNSGIRLSQREVLPYSFYLSKADNPVIKVIDLTKIRGGLERLTAPDGSIASGLWDNVDGFMGDLAKYFTNLDAKENARRSVDLFGADKARFLGDFVNEQEKGGRKFVRDLRLDRIGSTAPMPFRARISEDAIQLSKLRWMPAETIGDKSVINSEEGYRIISGAKHKLYGPDGKLLGIYDTQTQAERKADATQARLQPEVRQQQYPARDEGRQTAEAGRGDSALGRTQGREEGRQELGAVRQEGDVVIAPDAESFTIPKADIGRFMPASDKVNIEDYADRKILALAADRMGIGQMSVGPKGAKRDLSVLGQGGRGFMNIFNGGGWAFSDFGTADRFLKRLRSEADPDGNVIVGITVQSPINHLKNQTGQLAYIEAMQAAIDSKTITKRAADAQVAAMSSAIVQSTAKSIKQSARDKFAEIKSFKDLKKAVTNKQLNFADMEPMLTQMQRKALPITHKELSDIGMTAADIARDLSDPELADVPFGSVVALLGVNVKQAPEKTGIHYSYPWTIHGDAIGYLNKFYNISDLSTEKRIRNAQGVVTAQPLQTVMPVMDNIINTIKTKQGIPSDPSMRFMPSDTDYLDAVQKGDTQAAQRMVDEAAKAAGYTTKVFHGSISQFNKPNTPLFLGDEGTAMSYAQDRAMAYGEGANPVTYKLYAKFKNPASETDVKQAAMDLGLKVENDMAYTALDPQISGSRYVSRVISELKKRGYDSANIDDFSPNSAQNVIKSFVAFDPSQLKRSDPITRDDAGNVIPLSKRFQQTSEDIRYMPSDDEYLTAVKRGNTSAAQDMVDAAAKAAGYTVGPVYHGTPTGGFNVFDKRMRGETSGVSRQAFSFTTDKKAAEGYSKRLGDEAVRLDAGLRVANDAMRRFDDDVAAQEYFSSKGYSSVEDGMLPEFDWGSIDDVPEFIKELRGHAKDLKPINPDLASSFVEAAKVMSSTKAVPEVKRVFLRIPQNAPVFQATPATLGMVMRDFSAEREPTKAGIVELPGNERIYYVADSSQVKLADPVTKDAQGNVIPLSKRFQASSEDIRYMPDYSGEHRAPRRDSGAPLDNLKDVYPDDVYGPNAARYYGHESGSQTDKAAVRIIQATKGKPDAPVKVFRAIPKSIESNEINPGDWITTIKSYAVQHGEGPLGGDYKILEKTVPAGDLYTDGNSIFEFGYDPKFMPQPDSSMPGAYSFQGGYRAIPGKTKGSLRLYGPAGSLIGIASSLDEAQRIIRRKATK